MFRGCTDDIKALVRLSALVNASLDLTDVLNNAMTFVEELTNAEASSIFELDRERNELCFRLARGKEGEKVREVRLAMGEGIAGWVAREGKPLLVTDVTRDQRFTPRIDQYSGFETRSVACVPIRYKGRLIGVLELLNTEPEPDEHDLELLTVASNQIGIAMENARLYQRLQDKFSLSCEELKKTQQKLIRSERLVALARLSQGIAHEVRNPVMSIGGFALRLKQRLPAGDPGYKYIEIILEELARLEQMVQDVEDYTSLREPEFREVELRNLLQTAVQEWHRQAVRPDIEVRLDLPEAKVTFPGDRWLLSLMLENLLQNAGEAMSTGGRLSVSARTHGGAIHITVADTGSGIAPEDIPQIFDPFFTSSSFQVRGSGLGLTTVHRIVTDHHGEIRVRSTPGEGTEFEIILPLHPDDMDLSALETRS
jgi:signal transduction histidine kinase